ncbi:MAG: hypothetical protein BZ135_06830 [Methanosphaera sp. rholeuAM6]|nr:MAG: hypothetical protein BZ135_06830 [Methanosphaera sp. rholeuAM6]
MNNKNIIKNYKIEKLNRYHEVGEFDCGNNNLNKYLKEKALFQQEEQYNVTYIVRYGEDIVAYFSLFADSFRTKNNPELNTKYEFCPAIKIGRLAVDNKFGSIGLGTNLLDEITKKVIELSENVGIMFLTIDAYFNAYPFYQKNSFKFKDRNIIRKLKNKAKRNPYLSIQMYKDIRRIINN